MLLRQKIVEMLAEDSKADFVQRHCHSASNKNKWRGRAEAVGRKLQRKYPDYNRIFTKLRLWWRIVVVVEGGGDFQYTDSAGFLLKLDQVAKLRESPRLGAQSERGLRVLVQAWSRRELCIAM